MNLFSDSPVVQHPETGRWYITAGRRNFNSRANNGAGYSTEAAALRASGSSESGIRHKTGTVVFA